MGGENWGSTSGTILSYTSAIKQRYKGIPYSKKKSGDTKKSGKKYGGTKTNHIHTPNMVSQLYKKM